MKPLSRLALAALATLVLACGSRGKDDPLLRLSAEESLAQGKTYFAAEKYGRSRPYFQHAFEVEPNSAIGREALLLVADSLFMDKSTANLIQAEAKYRDYQNRFPTSNRAAYVQFRLASSLAERIGRPDRDQKTTRDALAAFQDLIRLYPTSEYVEAARDEIRKVESNLAEHEYLVGRFYLRYGLPAASAVRFETCIDQYPQFGRRDEALYYLGLTYRRLARPEDAENAFSRLRRDFPGSEWISEIPKEKP